jgi:2-hydroxychromene-2-carboxylate isomerase
MGVRVRCSTMPIRFHFDFLSPYAYLAWTRIHDLAARHGQSVEPVPVVFGALLAAHGTLGPAEVPARRRYLMRDVLRIAHQFDVPLAPPPAHPFNPLLALRVSSLVLEAEQKRLLIDRLFTRTWVDGRGIDTREAVEEAITSCGFDAKTLLDEAESDATKARLRAQTDTAIAAGIFGVPTMMVGDEMFWGCDALPHLEVFLRGENVVPEHLIAHWKSLPVGVTRKR